MNRIETQRLLLRPFEKTDYDDLFELLSQRKYDEFEAYPEITYENGRVIGNVYFGNRDFEAKEVGYIINKNYQRQGYASEAIKAVIDDGFKNNVHRVYAECNPNNTCSWQLLEHLHFKREAFFKQNVYF